MQMAIVYMWSGTRPGREAQAMAHMNDCTAYMEKALAEGRISDYAWYLAAQGGPSFAIVRGEAEALQQSMNDPELLALNMRSELLNEGWRWGLYATGDTVELVAGLFAATAEQVNAG